MIRGRLSPNRRQGKQPRTSPTTRAMGAMEVDAQAQETLPGVEAGGTKATLLPRSKDDKGCHPGIRQGWTAICKAIGGNTNNTGNDFYDEAMKLLAEIHKKAEANWAQMSAACNTASIIEKDAYRTGSFSHQQHSSRAWKDTKLKQAQKSSMKGDKAPHTISTTKLIKHVLAKYDTPVDKMTHAQLRDIAVVGL